ncbi:hypothetical protein AV530_009910 [Patagioenas fasciata monilis]|uniref:Uncharacterized protein n=1 Tax=Patagioenas fasciata monilis TaxID=372326 RepID=A0A1V4KC64_PATFA|nr:hypothetical protein AV530_009910 [Patagioenas fasciata monilis]
MIHHLCPLLSPKRILPWKLDERSSVCKRRFKIWLTDLVLEHYWKSVDFKQTLEDSSRNSRHPAWISAAKSYTVTMMKFCCDGGKFFPGCVWTVEDKTDKKAENLFGRDINSLLTLKVMGLFEFLVLKYRKHSGLRILQSGLHGVLSTTACWGCALCVGDLSAAWLPLCDLGSPFTLVDFVKYEVLERIREGRRKGI